MKSIELHIAQNDASPNRLCWSITSNGIKTSGIFEVETRDDIARFTACAAHVFNAMKPFKDEPCSIHHDEPTETERYQHLDDWMKLPQG